jgi:hypothetical protein
MQSMSDQLALRQCVLNVGGIDRIHIVGAARSGTTMLHYAFSAFERVVLFDEETNPVRTPSMTASLGLALRNMVRRERAIFVTKRNYGWFQERNIQQLAQEVRRSRMGLINIVRDPRDAMTSVHSTQKSFYLEPERWLASVAAAETLFAQLEGHNRKLTIKYEDVVLNPGSVQSLLERQLGLRLREGITSWAEMAENVAALGQPVGRMRALHTLRNFDPLSIGGWKKSPEKVAYVDELMNHSELSTQLRQFMDRYNYE